VSHSYWHGGQDGPRGLLLLVGGIAVLAENALHDDARGPSGGVPGATPGQMYATYFIDPYRDDGILLTTQDDPVPLLQEL